MDKKSEIERLGKKVENCPRSIKSAGCKELINLGRNPVFDKNGNHDATLVFIGQAPGEDENKQGKPFAGKEDNQAGNFLDKILAMMQCKLPNLKLDRSSVFVCNTICCWPPKNPKGDRDRKPTGEEIENCRDFLKQTLNIIKPKFICCLGTIASRNFLGEKNKPLQTRQGEEVLRGVHKGRLVGGEFERGNFVDGVTVACTYHPTSGSRKEILKDICRYLIKEMKAAGLK